MRTKPKFIEIVPDGGPANVPGFSAGGVCAGVKPSGKADLALFRSDPPASTAAFFTLNRLKGAHIPIDREQLKASRNKTAALLVNSGFANCSTGKKGEDGAKKAIKTLAAKLGVPVEQTLIASTGVIGVQVPFDKVTAAYPALMDECKPTTEGSKSAVEAIMTTDTRPKSICVEFQMEGKAVRLAGCAKGSGMIAPNMATMFGFLFTDAKIAAAPLKKIMSDCVDRSFNAITVDGDTSPNDTVFAFANGSSGAKVGGPASRSFAIFHRAALFVCEWLAAELVADGEGAEKFVIVKVEKAPDSKKARAMACRIAESPLVKTAMHGSDPNWGRIVSAAGMCEGFEPALATLYLNGVRVYDRDRPIPCRPDLLKGKEIEIRLVCNTGKASWRECTCDFSHGYITINADYTT